MSVVALFGATGRTGRRVCERLTGAGHEVRALVRDPAKLSASRAVTVIVGDVLDADAVARTVSGSDAVVSVFGHVRGSSATVQTDGTRNIVGAMKEHGASRLVSLSGGGLRAPQDQPKTADRIIRFLLKTLSGKVLADAEGHLSVLEGSGLDWTVVRGPRLTEAPGVGRNRVGWVGVNASTKISRDDLADFIVTQIADRTYVGQLPFVSD